MSITHTLYKGHVSLVIQKSPAHFFKTYIGLGKVKTILEAAAEIAAYLKEHNL